jgi:hypothetical protein
VSRIFNPFARGPRPAVRPSLSRRALLGGATTLLALPFLESIDARKARAQDARPLRLMAFYIPCGIHMPAWTPATAGADWELTPILAPLADVKEDVLVLTGIANLPARPDGPGDHAAGTGTFLTCRHVFKTEGTGISNGISMDQVAAATLGQTTRIASLQLGIDGGDAVGDCDSGYSCAYARNISWASETQPLPKSTNPEVVWDLLFSGFDPDASAAERAKEKLYRTSILDTVKGQATTLNGKLGTSDRAKLDEYLTGIRELEEKIQAIDTAPACSASDRPPGGLPLPEHVQAMLDLTVLAMQCDASRVVSFMLGNAGSNRSYPFLEVPEGHHELSHHQDNPTNFEKLTIIDTWEVEQLAYLLGRMKATPDGEGQTLLDNSLVFFSSEIEDGNSHAHVNLPVIVAGSAGGAINPGRHVVYDDQPPMANLFTTMLNALGVEQETFGDDGTGPLDLG